MELINVFCDYSIFLIIMIFKNNFNNNNNNEINMFD